MRGVGVSVGLSSVSPSCCLSHLLSLALRPVRHPVRRCRVQAARWSCALVLWRSPIVLCLGHRRARHPVAAVLPRGRRPCAGGGGLALVAHDVRIVLEILSDDGRDARRKGDGLSALGFTHGGRGLPVGTEFSITLTGHRRGCDGHVGQTERHLGGLVQLPTDHLLAGGALPQRWHRATVIAARACPRPATGAALAATCGGAAGLPPPAQILRAFALPCGIQPHLEAAARLLVLVAQVLQIAPKLLHGPLGLGIPGESMHLAFR